MHIAAWVLIFAGMFCLGVALSNDGAGFPAFLFIAVALIGLAEILGAW